MTHLRARLDESKPLLMPHVVFNTGNFIDAIGTAGFECVLLDCEHTAASVERIDELCRAARAARIFPIVRPERLDGPIITRYLDCGAQGIMVPRIDSAAQAREFTAIMRYARPDTHQRILTIAMIESGEALDALDEILAVPDIDVFFVARNDLSKSLGYGDTKHHPEIRRITDDTIARIIAAGHIAGAGADLDNLATIAASGTRLILVSTREMFRAGAAQILGALG